MIAPFSPPVINSFRDWSDASLPEGKKIISAAFGFFGYAGYVPDTLNTPFGYYGDGQRFDLSTSAFAGTSQLSQIAACRLLIDFGNPAQLPTSFGSLLVYCQDFQTVAQFRAKPGMTRFVETTFPIYTNQNPVISFYKETDIGNASGTPMVNGQVSAQLFNFHQKPIYFAY